MSKICFSQRSRKLFFGALLACICLLAPRNAFTAPPQTVSGTVRDAGNGKPLVGATIAIKGGSQRTLSDVKGAFTITVPDANSVLAISYIGYVTREVLVGAG